MVERTCLTCGETWTANSALVRRKSLGPRQRGLSAADVRYYLQTPMSRAAMDQLFADAHLRDADADEDVELLRQLRTCPKCGNSDRYTETRIRKR